MGWVPVRTLLPHAAQAAAAVHSLAWGVHCCQAAPSRAGRAPLRPWSRLQDTLVDVASLLPVVDRAVQSVRSVGKQHSLSHHHVQPSRAAPAPAF